MQQTFSHQIPYYLPHDSSSTDTQFSVSDVDRKFKARLVPIEEFIRTWLEYDHLNLTIPSCHGCSKFTPGEVHLHKQTISNNKGFCGEEKAFTEFIKVITIECSPADLSY